MHTATLALLIVLKVAVAACIFAVGLDSTPKDAGYLLKRPALLGRSLLAMYVLVPLVAVVLAVVTTLPPGVKIALLVVAVSAGAPLLPRKLLGIGDGAYGFSLVLLSSVLAIVLVPLWLKVLGPYFASPPELGPLPIAEMLAKALFLPLLLGMALRHFLGARAAHFSQRLLGAGGLVLTVCALLLLAMHWTVALDAGWYGALTLFVLVAAALLIGHVLGGPTAQDRTTLAIACSSRHLGVAVTVAASLPGPKTATLIAVYVITSAAISLPYLRWRRAGAHLKTQGA